MQTTPFVIPFFPKKLDTQNEVVIIIVSVHVSKIAPNFFIQI
jgi:uncharacterized membrane protein YwzB